MNRIREIGENIKDHPCFKGTVCYDEPMAGHTTMKVGGRASVYVVPQDPGSAAAVVLECRKNAVPLVILGGGSNVVVSDDGIDGVVLSTTGLNELSFGYEPDTVELKDLPWKKGTLVKIKCGAGTSMNDVVSFCAEKGLLGMSCFAGLPGTVGGAAYMNARCYNKEASDVISEVTYINLDKLTSNADIDIANFLEIYHNTKEDWGYKRSPFASGNFLIVSVDFLCTAVEGKDVRDFILSENAIYVNDRTSKGHFKAPSAGSVFKNNRAFGKPSGMLVDEAGLKGLAIGGAQITPWHGNFIINKGNASASDIKKLVDVAVSKVKEMTGFVLEPEIIFI
ncbi:MAG: UDP-N-acetylmuramate dehydrogenase [Treponema sp.]|nr:UDP-N-acetylmuramate dehydrogenase [Treponema sp.]